jgi:hypothetical protein
MDSSCSTLILKGRIPKGRILFQFVSRRMVLVNLNKIESLLLAFLIIRKGLFTDFLAPNFFDKFHGIVSLVDDTFHLIDSQIDTRIWKVGFGILGVDTLQMDKSKIKWQRQQATNKGVRDMTNDMVIHIRRQMGKL